jgi:hypothetical protein
MHRPASRAHFLVSHLQQDHGQRNALLSSNPQPLQLLRAHNLLLEPRGIA